MNQNELAHRAGCLPSVIFHLETGSTRNSLSIVQIAHALDISPTWLVMGIGPAPLHGAAPIAAKPRLRVVNGSGAAQAARAIWSKEDIRNWDAGNERRRRHA